ncbi:MAG: hypothetical protein CMF25_04090 [Kangiellaceae bacterium]|jgi:NhaP-type Na+/H+ or K+/H+ antiporter|nr:hypothetical protein [Kangiellaceae bacterium]|tara:strand:- start:4294 stop:6339 length:2046 start_codon:yes stop_codon:yes gene_type:complete
MHTNLGVVIILFVCFALLVGAIVRYFLKSTPIPYTVALLMIGLSIGLAGPYLTSTESESLLNDVLQLISTIDPHLILLLFLPTLIFESAYSLEVHLFRRALPQIMTLAIPGLIIATVLTAILAMVAFPWQWTWSIALMFGALISATDPVAVVALLKEISSRKRLETLLEGESLLNDGTAIVLFVLFYNMATTATIEQASHGPLEWLYPVIEFCRVILLGSATGLALGWLAIRWIDHIFNDALIEITLSIVIAYLAFYIAEYVLHASGVVAVVTLGLYFARRGRSTISPEVGEFLHHFWEVMAFIANTLIFIIVGVVIAMRVEFGSLSIWGYLFLLYFSILVIRGISIVSFLPLLKKTGIGLNFEKFAVLTWGGLRGAVALALALSVAQHEAISHEIGSTILFLTAGIVVLTILINGSTMRMLLHFLKLDKLPPSKQETIQKAQAVVVNELQKEIDRLKNSNNFQYTNWQQIACTQQKTPTKLAPKAGNGLDIAFRRRLLEAERTTYWSLLREGYIEPIVATILSSSVDRALDGYPYLHPRSELIHHWSQSPPAILTFIQRWLPGSNDHHQRHYCLAKGFILAQQTIKNYVDELAPSSHAADEVLTEIDSNIQHASVILEDIRDASEQTAQQVETQIAQSVLLHKQRDQLYRLLKEGVLDVPEAEKMIHKVEKEMALLRKAY